MKRRTILYEQHVLPIAPIAAHLVFCDETIGCNRSQKKPDQHSQNETLCQVVCGSNCPDETDDTDKHRDRDLNS